MIPVGTAITIVAAEKNERESTSSPTVYMWCAQTMKPKKPIETIAPDIPVIPKTGRKEKTDVMLLIIPNAGRIRTYTSGCPKNQNKCWYSIGSPPPSGEKKEVPQQRSIKSIVNPPASTGNESSSRTDEITTPQTKRFSLE